jgi:S-adenosylmethionine decarboxylase
MPVGIEWIIDASGCRPDALRDAEGLRSLCEAVLRGLDLKVVGQGLWHHFPGPGAGLTGLYLLTESHLACHTYPENGLATFNLYCCRARPRWPWEEALTRALGARSVEVRSLARGAEPCERQGGPP